MTAPRMHEDEVDIDEHLVGRLLDAQFPEWAELPVVAIPSTGTVNAIYRLGEDLCVRLPRVRGWSGHLQRELEWLPRLAPRLSLDIPEPVAAGDPGCGYPFPWAVYRWIDGTPFTTDGPIDERRAARDLARFVAELRRIDPAGAPSTGRRPLAELDEVTRAAVDALQGVVDTERVTAAWDVALTAPAWDGPPVWRHCDLLPPNLLVADGRLCAVIDFGGVGVGDPAHDVIAAWSVFGADGRSAYRDALDVDGGTWARARGVALHQALLIIPYYPETNPAFVDMAMRTVEQVLADSDR